MEEQLEFKELHDKDMAPAAQGTLAKKKTLLEFTLSKVNFLSSLQKWVWAFRKDRLLTTINTNNGVERQNKGFKHEYLEGHQQATLSCMLSILIEEFLPEQISQVRLRFFS